MSPSTISISTGCVGCGLCIATCPELALRRARRRPVLLAERCTACLECVEVCPADAITSEDGGS
jgi:Fe-S-cluster-containing hydrogenase component 2